MEFRKSVKNDLKNIMVMIEDARLSLKSIGVDQWQDGNPSAEDIIADIKKGNSYVVVDDEGIVVGHGSLIFEAEPAYAKIFDGKWQSDKPYAAIHRIVTDTRTKSKGVASLIFQNFERLCLNNKVFWLRIDTHHDNAPMRNLIGKFNYQQSGIIYYNPKTKRIAFDKKLG